MRWPFRKPKPPELAYRHEVTQVGPVVYLKLMVAYEGVPQEITSFMLAMSHQDADQLHRDLSLAADRARRYREPDFIERTLASVDAVVGFMAERER